MTNGNGKVTKYKYDELSNVVEKVNSLGDTTKYTYDADDRLESVKQANGKTISYDYNKLDQLLQVNYSEKADGTVMYTYDSEGRRISMNDLTRQTQYEYNDEDEITGVRQGDGSLIKYTYDDYGNIKKMTYADKSEVKYSYDELDRLTKVTDKENQTTTYEYDDAGNMTKIKRKDGTTSTLTYRLDNRVEEIVHRNKKGKELASYRYEYNADTFISEEVITQAGKTVVQTYEYDSLGQVVQMTVFDKKKKQEPATYTYTYDQAGNKLTSTETIAGQEVKTEFTYDDNNRLLRMKNDQETITYEYDENGNRLKQSGTDETLDYIYDTENRLLAVKDNQGLLLAALYDGENNRVFTASRTEKTTAYQLFKRQEKKSKVAAKHVPADRRKSPATSPNGEENSLFWYGFTGNVLQALSSLPETVGDLWLEAFDTISRAYHQKIAKDRANEEGIVVNPPSLGKRPGEGKVTYSSEVNDVLIPYTTREDTYNYYEVRNYVNDVNQENTQVLQTYDDEKKTRETYTYGHERLSYTNHQTNEDYQYLTDARGSVTGLVQGEKITNTTHYSVFGRPTEKDDTGNPYGYTGEAQDITGYHYLRARYYDSHSGTFLTQDSYEGEEDNPLSQNGYTYVENNPINYTDPTGHKKNWFQNVWSGIKKTASKVVNKAKQVVSNVYNTAKKVVSTVWNGVKQVASSVWNGVKQVASSVYSGVTNFARTAYNTVSNYFSGGGTNYWQPASANYSGYSYYSGYPVASGAPSSQSTLSYAQIQAIQTAQRQQRLTADYQKATGSKGKPKTKEGQNLLRNWGQSLKNTLTKFCQTAKKVGKQVVEKAKSGVAFGAGVIKQSLSNNGIILPINSRLSRWLEQDWIKQNPAYNTGVFIGQLAGLAQAATEYVGAGLTFAAGTAGSGVLDAFVGVASGGTAAAAIPAMAVAEMAAVTAATAAIGAHASKVLQNNFNSRNYSSSKPNGKYEDAPYHNKNQGNATKSKAPKNGQKALDNSYEIKNTSKRRISVSDGEFVVLDETSNGLFHGHVRKWEELTNEMKSILQKNGLVNKKGKILK
nr:RHS repeat-associated core domain-containing protein [Enterococcus faecalis]